MYRRSMSEADIRKVIMTAINKVGGSEGASLDDIVLYLTSTLNDVPGLEKIQSSLNDAVAQGILLELDNGKYKIRGSSERAEATVDDANKNDKVLSKMCQENSKSVNEDLQKVERSVDKVSGCLATEDKANVSDLYNEDSDDSNDSEDSDDSNDSEDSDDSNDSSSSDDDNKVLSKTYHEDNEMNITDNNEMKATKRCENEERCVDKATQDANQNADSDTGNLRFSVMGEDDEKNDKEEIKKDCKKNK